MVSRGVERVVAIGITILLFGAVIGLIIATGLKISSDNQTKATAASVVEMKKVVARIEAEKVAKAEVEEKERLEREAAEAAETAKKAAEEEAAAKKTASAGTTPTQPASCNQSSSHNNPASIDVVVNKKNCLVPINYAPADLVTSNGATLSAKAVASFNQMFAAAAAAGQPFTVSSSYRSYATQVSTYNYWVSISGQTEADTYSARPGFSEHQTGLVVDVGANGCNLNCFGSTSQYQWFQENAAKYGFIQRYYAGYEHITGYVSEEWHYRYVGVAVAEDMKAKGIKTLEQYWGIAGGDYR